MNRHLRQTATNCHLLIPRVAAKKMAAFVVNCQNSNGGFSGRTEESDLYYSYFAVEILNILGESIPGSFADYLQNLSDIHNFDLVHLSCYIHCYTGNHENRKISAHTGFLIKQLQQFRTLNGAVSMQKNAKTGSVYACFLYCLASSALQSKIENANRIIEFITKNQSKNGYYSANTGDNKGVLPVTCAAVSVLHFFNHPVSSKTTEWLVNLFWEGGFRAAVNSPVSDLLSTATALYVFFSCNYNIQPFKHEAMQFIQSLWCENGGFYAHKFDTDTDCEFTYYALLGLGVLAKYS